MNLAWGVGSDYATGWKLGTPGMRYLVRIGMSAQAYSRKGRPIVLAWKLNISDGEHVVVTGILQVLKLVG